MPKVPSATLPPRLSRKRFSPISTTMEPDAAVLLRYKHINHYRTYSATFDAALAMCQLQATSGTDMNGADISHRPSRRRRTTYISATGSISSNITLSSLRYLSVTSSSLSTPGPAYGPERPSRSRWGPQRRRITNPAYGSTSTTRVFEETEGTPAVVASKCPPIKISLASLEKLRRSLHKKPSVYRMIDPNYGSKKRKRD